MAIRLRTRITLTFEFVTTLTIVLMSVILAVFALGRITLFYYQQGQMLNLIGQANIEYALALPQQAATWTGQQAVLTGLAIGELVEVAEKRAGMPREEINAMLDRIVREGAKLNDPPLLEGVRVRGPNGDPVYSGGEHSADALLPESYQEALPGLLQLGAKPLVAPLHANGASGSGRYAVAVPGISAPRVIELSSTDALAEALNLTFDVEDVMTRFLLNAEIDRIAIVNMKGEVEASAGESFHPDQPIADDEVVKFCVTFLEEHQRRAAFQDRRVAEEEAGNAGANPAPSMRAPSDEVNFVNFLDVENEEGEFALGVATLVDSAPGGPPRALFIQHKTAGMVDVIQGGLRNLVFMGLVMILLTGIAGIWLSRRLARPLVRLAEAAQSIAAGNFSYRVPVSGDREVRIVAKAFNQMVDSIQRHTLDLQRETQLRERLESDYRIGAEIQRSLLPVGAPEVRGVQVAGWSEAAREVGGDFYDFRQIDDHRLGLALGDASGKGLPAALLVTECSSVIRALAEERYSLGELLAKTNNALVPRLSEAGNFVTLFLAEVNSRRGKIFYTSAGHNPPLLAPADGSPTRWLACHDGVPLGISPGCQYSNYEEPLAPGDTIVVYSDGITDARNKAGEFYGKERLEAILATSRAQPVPELLQTIINDVRKFLGDRDAADDMSLLVVRRTNEA
jgi:serine phosphatase RsbU (regulator of sigma subunit)